MAAEASVAVDEHEKAWGVSKEKAEVLFNDLRLAPEEDAQQSCDDAASATRHRLQSILVKVRAADTVLLYWCYPWRLVPLSVSRTLMHLA